MSGATEKSEDLKISLIMADIIACNRSCWSQNQNCKENHDAFYGESFIEFKPVVGKTKLFNDVEKAFWVHQAIELKAWSAKDHPCHVCHSKTKMFNRRKIWFQIRTRYIYFRRNGGSYRVVWRFNNYALLLERGVWPYVKNVSMVLTNMVSPM